jgi:hypothetical protein
MNAEEYPDERDDKVDDLVGIHLQLTFLSLLLS